MAVEETVRSRGEIYEGIAFQFCKIATFALIAGRFALPLAAGLCSAFFIAAYVNGVRTSRCVLRRPLLIAAIYGAVTVLSAWFIVHPIRLSL